MVSSGELKSIKYPLCALEIDHHLVSFCPKRKHHRQLAEHCTLARHRLPSNSPVLPLQARWVLCCFVPIGWLVGANGSLPYKLFLAPLRITPQLRYSLTDAQFSMEIYEKIRPQSTLDERSMNEVCRCSPSSSRTSTVVTRLKKLISV